MKPISPPQIPKNCYNIVCRATRKSKGNIISDIKREEEESWETKLGRSRDDKSIFPVLDNGSMIAINRKTDDRELCGEPHQSYSRFSSLITIPSPVIRGGSPTTSDRASGGGGTLVILKRDFSRFRRGLS